MPSLEYEYTGLFGPHIKKLGTQFEEQGLGPNCLGFKSITWIRIKLESRSRDLRDPLFHLLEVGMPHPRVTVKITGLNNLISDVVEWKNTIFNQSICSILQIEFWRAQFV